MKFDVDEVTRKVLAAVNAGRYTPITEGDVRPVAEKVKRELDAVARRRA